MQQHPCPSTSVMFCTPGMLWLVVQALGMWEDSSTGAFKFRARRLVHASDLPADTLPRLRASRETSAADRSSTGSKTSSTIDKHEADQVFLTRRIKDIEVSSITKPITLCGSTSEHTEASPGKGGNLGPRLTRLFCESCGDFHPLESTDPILARARARRENTLAFASRFDLENNAAQIAKPVVKCNGCLLPKRADYHPNGRSDPAHGAGGGIRILISTRSNASSTSIDVEASDRRTEELPNAEDGEWNEGEGGEDDDYAGSGSPGSPMLSGIEGLRRRKSTRHRKSQRSPMSGVDVDSLPREHVENRSEPKVCPLSATSAPTFERHRRVSFVSRRDRLLPRPRRSTVPPLTGVPLVPLVSHVFVASPHGITKSFAAMEVVRPVFSRMGLELPISSPARFPDASAEDEGNISPQFLASGKRRRSGATRKMLGASRLDYPPRRTPVGKQYQADIPDLLSDEDRQQPHTGAGGKAVGGAAAQRSLFCRTLRNQGTIPTLMPA